MKYFMIFCAVIMSMNVVGETVTSRIESYEMGADNESDIIRLSNSEVVFLDPSDDRDEQRAALNESLLRGEAVMFSIDQRRSALSMQTVTVTPDILNEGELRTEHYDPTPISLSESTTFFKKMRRDWQNKSQCYNRAHIWAYEEFRRSGIKSMKLFLFFTSRYIRNYRYHWWFHVTPMGVLTDGSWRTLDRRYSSGPLTLKTWTDKFIYSRRSCPVVYKYSDYRQHQYSEDCYLIPVSMYYWQPRDIDRYERTGYQKHSFITSEINHAYWEAF